MSQNSRWEDDLIMSSSRPLTHSYAYLQHMVFVIVRTEATDVLPTYICVVAMIGFQRIIKVLQTMHCYRGVLVVVPPHHRVLFNHPSTATPPPSTIHPALHTTGSCSTTPPRPPLHRLLFIQPSTPRGPVQPPLHGHPSIVYCSSSPPHHGVLFIQRQRHHSLFIHPPGNPHCSSNRSASVSSSSEGIAPSGLVNSHRSIARVQ